MESVLQFLENLYSSDGLKQLIINGGIWILIAIVFSETGLLVGFFLPGDSLLVTAGVLSSTSFGSSSEPLLNVWELNIGLIIAAFVGDQVNYYFGRRAGLAIFQRDDSRFFKKKYVLEAHEFYLQNGGKAVVIARFLPILRTFVPFIAGVASMPYRRYMAFSILGSILWVTSMVWIGHAVGQTAFGQKLHYVILMVIGISFIPLAVGVIKRVLSVKRGAAVTPAQSTETITGPK